MTDEYQTADSAPGGQISQFFPVLILLIILTVCQGSAKGGMVFSSAHEGNWDIFYAPTDGSPIVNLTRFPALEKHPAMSPDGQTIAFVSSRDNNYEIYLIQMDGSNLTRLSQHPNMDTCPA